MTDHDLGALHGIEGVVGVDTMLVFGEECGIGQLAYVVVEGSGTDELHLGADAVCGSGGEI